MLSKLKRFLTEDIWRIRVRDLAPKRSMLIRPLRILVLAIRGFDEDKCGLRASALTYYSLLSVVPVLAMAFGVAKGFGLEERLQDLIRTSLMPEAQIEAVLRAEIPGTPDPGAPTPDTKAPGEREPGSPEGDVSAAPPGSAAESAASTAATASPDGQPSAPGADGQDPGGGGESGDLTREQTEAIVDFREAVVERLIEFADSLLGNVRGDVVAATGVALLFWLVVRVLGSIEESFNDIWGIHRGRSITRRFSEYLSLLLICPVLVIGASSLTIYIAGMVRSMGEAHAILDPLVKLFFVGVRLLPYVVMWMLFSFLYLLMPNTRVSLKAAISGGIVAGTAYQLVQWAYIHFQIGVTRNNAIYGSFAAVPLFLVWLNLSWIVALFGAELAFAVDHEETYEFEKDARSASLRLRQLVALEIVRDCARRFVDGTSLPDAEEISHRLAAPIRLVRDTLFALVESRILTEVRDANDEREAFQPGRPVDSLTIHAVLRALAEHGSSHPGMVRGSELAKVQTAVDALDGRYAEAPENVPLKDL